jgi:Uri superfamily endonuclease
MRFTGYSLDSTPGTYALLLELHEPTELRVGRLGRIYFDSPFYLYFGSALGPGGLGARLKRHLQPTGRTHWHIDYLRQVAEVLAVWHTRDTVRLECTWANAALALRGVSFVPRFGSSDCRCHSHLLAVERPRQLYQLTNRRSWRPKRFAQAIRGVGQGFRGWITHGKLQAGRSRAGIRWQDTP